jgi:hypothetical protein
MRTLDGAACRYIHLSAAESETFMHLLEYEIWRLGPNNDLPLTPEGARQLDFLKTLRNLMATDQAVQITLE